jgi:hypothetical protein
MDDNIEMLNSDQSTKLEKTIYGELESIISIIVGW